MTTRTVIVEETVLRCRAPHPDGETKDHLSNRIHNTPIVTVPFQCRPTGRQWRPADSQLTPLFQPDEREGRFLIPAYCRCGVVTEYEVVAPPEMAAAVAREQQQSRRPSSPRNGR